MGATINAMLANTRIRTLLNRVSGIRTQS